MPSHVECPNHVAIVGSGPSGFFAAASLLKAADASNDIDIAIDMLEMLPCPPHGVWCAPASRSGCGSPVDLHV